MINRREMLRMSTVATASIPFITLDDFLNNGKMKGFKVGACDWSIGQRAKVEAMSVAKSIGLDGVQVSLGTVEDNMHLRTKAIQEAYKKASKENGVAIGGMAIGELNSVPYKSAPETEQWVLDSIDVAKAMGVKVVLLAFFGKGDIKGDKEGTKEVIKRLKKAAPKAEKEKITLGIESWLSAKEHMEIIDAVESDMIKVYYDTANSNKMGYDIYEEIRWLGKKNICEFHLKENGNLLGEGVVDFKKVRAAIDDIGYRGWVQIEGAIPEGGERVESYIKNREFVKSLFPDKIG
ncbi:sugar phosphate isomerase/epimerase family protein [Flexithrix dorotheae]|uniref:sugar phosphate isomerase/epimerase family protein n=1 Tax=Flexithrix dorotheae TaxID=70993 RepID=UPI00037F6DFD|nr:sugar phosphate isomerase/epimerase family protein [Flexithrix dorotheae]